MTAKITADATGTKVLIGVAAEDSLQIDGTAKTVKALAPYAVGAQKVQLGSSATPANNFTLDASADNGTMKLARGNAGSTTQDVMTVLATGKVDFPQLARSISGGAGSSGYITLPGGLIVQWGSAVVSTVGANTWANSSVITLPIPFPTAFIAGVATPRNQQNVSGQAVCWSLLNVDVTGAILSVLTQAGAVANNTCTFIVIGY